jgi:hypothetical protein
MCYVSWFVKRMSVLNDKFIFSDIFGLEVLWTTSVLELLLQFALKDWWEIPENVKLDKQCLISESNQAPS